MKISGYILILIPLSELIIFIEIGSYIGSLNVIKASIRAKVPLTKRITFTNPQYEGVISKEPSASGIYQCITASISAGPFISMSLQYHYGDNGYFDTGNPKKRILFLKQM